MKDFAGKLAVITGGGTGMGRALARQLIAEGCDVAICDVIDENMQETVRLCESEAPQGIKITAHKCDVSNEAEVQSFKQEVVDLHGRDHINLLFNNAGIAGMYSFVDGDRDGWERTFNICWYGVYYCSRAFMPLLVASKEGHLVNTSSVNGFWASVGTDTTHSAYSAAKFAVKGFTEALINDFRINAPHVKVSVVMPGHIGTSIVINSGKLLGGGAESMSDEDVQAVRERAEAAGTDLSAASNDDIRALVKQRAESFRDDAPMSAEEAARDILAGVKAENWRVLLGKDAVVLDELVREDPKSAYEESFMTRLRDRTNWGLDS